MKTEVNCTILDKGWLWVEFNDGSGYLKSPEGHTYYSFDLMTYSMQDGVEYMNRNSYWSVFWGSFEEFKKFCEMDMLERLGNKHSMCVNTI